MFDSIDRALQVKICDKPTTDLNLKIIIKILNPLRLTIHKSWQQFEFDVELMFILFSLTV